MSFRGMAFLAGTTLALLGASGCGARGSGTLVTETDIGSPADGPGVLVDAGVAPVDTGVVGPVDTGVTPVDTGVVGPSCPSPRRLCDGVCVDVRTDIAHCGACSSECGSGQFCSGGTCRSTSECAAPRMTCGASCIDITSDVFNCGACNRRCGDGQNCVASQCVGGTPTCPGGTMLCGARCISVASDPANCGACGRACASGTTCTGGACVALATGIAASGACTTETCGPSGELQCSRALAGGGFCSGFCATGNTASEQEQCGGAGSTCVANPPFADVPAGQGFCLRACNPAAASEATGGCRAGQVCTGFWLYAPSASAVDSPGCFPHCATDAHCAGAGSGDAGLMRCNVRTGRCSTTPVNLTLRFDGDPCDPSEVMATGRPVCRGVCFRVGTDATQGICGSYLNLGVSTDCPDNAALIRPVAPGNDNEAVCVFKNCLHNSECTSPLRCVYPEAEGVVRDDIAPRCHYATALQPAGLP
ncbi:MAG: hypothetical protein Q8S73_25085 [Deltaproteobacteria bacterium]|nr:hypothetical protein [Myxococcales bacterium]MDP3217410.1 hypothetical protein [Deltaproteobacteria bacterium]